MNINKVEVMKIAAIYCRASTEGQEQDVTKNACF
jgi:hypothetical protein